MTSLSADLWGVVEPPGQLCRGRREMGPVLPKDALPVVAASDGIDPTLAVRYYRFLAWLVHRHWQSAPASATEIEIRPESLRWPETPMPSGRSATTATMPDNTLHIAEIPYETGELQFRYSRYLNAEGTEWIRHGLFRAFHKNGQLASEGTYEHGLEEGLWRDFHENGQLAAQGHYRGGEEYGDWQFFGPDGEPES